MDRRINPVGIFLILIFQFFFLFCRGEMKESAQPEKSVSEKNMDKDRARTTSGKLGVETKEDKGSKKDGKEGLKTYQFSPGEFAMGRLLEYTVSLSYRSDDLYKSRQLLFEMIPRYGFIKNSNSSIQGNMPYMTSSISVKSEMLYEALLEFSRLGILLNEKIIVFDHTENMVLNERRAKREQLRITRRNKAANQVTARSKTWKDTEDSLERSENSLDKSEHEKWKIRDRVSWATVNISLSGPEMPDIVQIHVPTYSNAFKEMINILLQIIYLLIVIMPVAVILSIIIWKRRIILKILPGSRDEEKKLKKKKSK